MYLGSQHMTLPARCSGGRCRSIDATGARAAANQLHVIAAYWLLIDGTYREHRTVTQRRVCVELTPSRPAQNVFRI